VYEALDDALGEILAAVTDDTLFCLLSDHGSTPAFRYISLFRALSEGGWLKFKPAIAGRYFQRLPVAGKLANRAWEWLPENLRITLSFPFLALDDRFAAAYENVDWPNTSVYARTGMGPLYVNRSRRRPEGTISPSDCPNLLDEIRAYFLSLLDGDGIPLFAEVLFGSEMYPDAEPADDPPDLLLRPARWSDHLITGFPSDPLVRRIPDSREYGTHSPDGVLVFAGPNVRLGHDLGRGQLIDVVPTMLALMGLPVPHAVDGRVLEDASNAPLSVKYADEEGPLEKRNEFTEAEAREISKRLEDLGYL
jgi:predicted AlkP superfamily phosphohydrolase/phosphomutase